MIAPILTTYLMTTFLHLCLHKPAARLQLNSSRDFQNCAAVVRRGICEADLIPIGSYLLHLITMAAHLWALTWSMMPLLFGWYSDWWSPMTIFEMGWNHQSVVIADSRFDFCLDSLNNRDQATHVSSDRVLVQRIWIETCRPEECPDSRFHIPKVFSYLYFRVRVSKNWNSHRKSWSCSVAGKLWKACRAPLAAFIFQSGCRSGFDAPAQHWAAQIRPASHGLEDRYPTYHFRMQFTSSFCSALVSID